MQYFRPHKTKHKTIVYGPLFYADPKFDPRIQITAIFILKMIVKSPKLLKLKQCDAKNKLTVNVFKTIRTDFETQLIYSWYSTVSFQF